MGIHGMLMMILVHKKIQIFSLGIASVYGSVALLPVHQDTLDPPEHRPILSESSVPVWVDNDSSTGHAIWLQSRHSQEGEAFAMSVHYQLMRLNAIATDEEFYSADSFAHYDQIWSMLSVEDRMYCLINLPASKYIWASQPLPGKSQQQFLRDRLFTTRIALGMMATINKELLQMDGPRPERLVSIRPELLVMPGTLPEDIEDELVREEYVEVLRLIRSNRQHNAVYESLADLKIIMDDTLPVFLQIAFDLDEKDDAVELNNLLIQYNLSETPLAANLHIKEDEPAP